jgi:hypothetical protein
MIIPSRNLEREYLIQERIGLMRDDELTASAGQIEFATREVDAMLGAGNAVAERLKASVSSHS